MSKISLRREELFADDSVDEDEEMSANEESSDSNLGETPKFFLSSLSTKNINSVAKDISDFYCTQTFY